jgi:septation ring formation regulator EzrA
MRESWTDARLSDFAAHTDRRFDTVDQRLEAVDRRFDTVDQRFEAVDRRFDAVDQRFEAVDKRFDAVDQRFNRVDADLRALRGETKAEFVAVRGEMNARFERVDARLDDLQRTMLQLGGGTIVTVVVGFVGVIVTQL